MKKRILTFMLLIISLNSIAQKQLDITLPGGSGGGGSSTAWGQIQGTLSNQTDLQTALDAKKNKNDSTSISGYATVYSRNKARDSVVALIPAQFNPIAGQNVSTSGSYPNITFNSSPSTDVNQYTYNCKFCGVLAGVIRATASGASTPITWQFIDTTSGHTYLGFDSVHGNGNGVEMFYPTAKYVSSLIIAPDESLASVGVVVGSSVGVSSSIAYAYFPSNNAGRLSGQDSIWAVTTLQITGQTYNSSTGLTQFYLGGTNRSIYAGETYGTVIQYVGNRNLKIRRSFSGVPQIGFYLVDSTNTIVTGSLLSTDYVTVSAPTMSMRPIPAQTTTSEGFPQDIYTASANYWVIGLMEFYIIATPLTTSSIKIEWQSIASVTSYRITRALFSSPASETTIYTGSNLTFNDTGLTTGTKYMYRLYKTVSAVETLVSNYKCKTL